MSNIVKSTSYDTTVVISNNGLRVTSSGGQGKVISSNKPIPRKTKSIFEIIINSLTTTSTTFNSIGTAMGITSNPEYVMSGYTAAMETVRNDFDDYLEKDTTTTEWLIYESLSTNKVTIKLGDTLALGVDPIANTLSFFVNGSKKYTKTLTYITLSDTNKIPNIYFTGWHGGASGDNYTFDQTYNYGYNGLKYSYPGYTSLEDYYRNLYVYSKLKKY